MPRPRPDTLSRELETLWLAPEPRELLTSGACRVRTETDERLDRWLAEMLGQTVDSASTTR